MPCITSKSLSLEEDTLDELAGEPELELELEVTLEPEEVTEDVVLEELDVTEDELCDELDPPEEELFLFEELEDSTSASPSIGVSSTSISFIITSSTP